MVYRHIKRVAVFSAASSLGSDCRGCRYGPSVFHQASARRDGLIWHQPAFPQSMQRERSLVEFNQRLSHCSEQLCKKGRPFVFLTGDHSSAMGLWGGVMRELVHQGKRFGLIWIDAHMDAHTTESSPSGNIHGMPVTGLLGIQDPLLDRIRQNQPILAPDQIVLLGVRSFEKAEMQHLDQLGVQYLTASRLRMAGLKASLLHTWKRLAGKCDVIGISIDLDAIDPLYAPGVAVPVLHGIKLPSLVDALACLPVPVALEISEYNPYADLGLRTLGAINQLIEAALTRNSVHQ